MATKDTKDANPPQVPSTQCCCQTQKRPALTGIEEDIWTDTVRGYRDLMPRVQPSVTANANVGGGDTDPSVPFCPAFVNLVSRRRPNEPKWLYRLRQEDSATNGEDSTADDEDSIADDEDSAAEDDANYGFSVNIADIQRMYMRMLQGRINWLALSAGFDEDCGIGENVPKELGPALREYGWCYYPTTFHDTCM